MEQLCLNSISKHTLGLLRRYFLVYLFLSDTLEPQFPNKTELSQILHIKFPLEQKEEIKSLLFSFFPPSSYISLFEDSLNLSYTLDKL